MVRADGSGDPRAQHNLAAMLEREKKYDEAIKLYTRAAEQGFEASEMNLAQMYEKGIGMKQDRAEELRNRDRPYFRQNRDGPHL